MRFRPHGFLLLLTLAAGAFTVLPASRSFAAFLGTHSRNQPQEPQRITIGVGLVNLYATVRDIHKAVVANLEQANFKVFEDNVEQKVAFFSRESTLPLTMGLLIDTSGSETAMIGAEQQAASQFLGRVMQKKDEAMVITFDLDVDMLADWTNDLQTLNRAIRRARINTAGGGGPVTPGPFPTSGQGGTNFYDAVYVACHDKMSTEAGRKALIIMTDAEDNGSKMKLEDAIEAAQKTDTVIHVLLIADPRAGFSLGGGGDMSVAKKLAEETGGRAIDVRNEKDLLKAFDQISEELRSEYQIGYYPTNAKHDGTYRHIRVETTNKDNKVLARKGYYAKTDEN